MQKLTLKGNTVPNIFWYILIGVIGLGIIICTMYKKKDVCPVSTQLVFCLYAAGISWFGEFIVLGLFDAYAYKIGVFADPWAQNVLAHKLLNTTLYPAVALVTVMYSLRYYWIIIFSAAFVLIDFLFINLRVYEHHWWRYYMTALTAASYILVTKSWFKKMIKKPYGLTRAVTFYFAAMVIIDFVPSILTIIDMQRYHIDWVNNLFGDPYRSSTFILFTYHMIECFFTVWFVCILKKWYWKIAPFIFSFTTLFIFAKINILIIEDGWKLIYTALINAVILALFILFEKYSLKQDIKISLK